MSEGYSHSCSQCLQTNNACGWCIYNKVCSGTPARCTNETNWYQLNGTNTTYVDVCPLLEPSSTPTRDYVQPVGVDRDIQLQTRNLPAPVSAELSFSIPKHFVSALIPSPNHADQWIQLCLSSERHVGPSNSLQQWELPHLSGEPKSDSVQ